MVFVFGLSLSRRMSVDFQFVQGFLFVFHIMFFDVCLFLLMIIWFLGLPLSNAFAVPMFCIYSIGATRKDIQHRLVSSQT